MELTDAIKKRRAIKHFDPDYQITDAEVKELLSLTLMAPTAFNIQNWRFVIVRDKDLLNKIQQASWNQAQITESSLLVILTADLKAFEKQPARYWKNAPEPVQEFILPAIDAYYRGKDQIQRDEAMRSTGIAASYLMLTAKAMGYDSCPMDGFDYDAVGKLINLPDDHVISMFVVIGKAVKEAWPKGGQLPIDEVLINNSF